MYKFFLPLIALMVFSTSLFSQEPLEPGKDYVAGKIILKLKNTEIPQTVNDNINNSDNAVSFGVSEIDTYLQNAGLKNITQKFPHHSKPEFQAKVRSEYGTDVKTLENIYTLDFNPNTNIFGIIKELKNIGNVEYAEPVYIDEEYAIPNDPMWDNLQDKVQMMCPEAWDIHKGEDGPEVIIGVCDSGTEWFHDDLVDNIYQNLAEDADGDGSVIEWDSDLTRYVIDQGDINGVDDDNNGFADDVLGWNFTSAMDGTESYDPYANPTNAHGTHVAGLCGAVTGNGIGVAAASWNVKLLITKHGKNFQPNANSIYYAYDGVLYHAENGADIVNMSWGGGSFSYYAYDIVQYANSLGAMLIAAAGNDNTTNPHYPSSYPGVISVASVSNLDKKSYYSTHGITVDISAPGGDAYVDGGLLSTVPGNTYQRFQGTSMASPNAASVFALAKSYFPNMTNTELAMQVIGNTDNIYDLNPNYANFLGAGRINAYKALTGTPQVDEGLKLSFIDYNMFIIDDYGDTVYVESLQPGEEAYIEFILSNSNMFSTDGSFDVEISNNSAYISGIQSSSYNIGPDELLTDTYKITVSEDAPTHFADLTLKVADAPNIMVSDEINLNLFICRGGILIYEPVQGGDNMSGDLMLGFMLEQGYDEVYYTNDYVPTFKHFDAVFMSYGNANQPGYSSYEYELHRMINRAQDYALIPGKETKIFFESSNFFSNMKWWYLETLVDPVILGLDDVNSHPGSLLIDDLQGQSGTFMEGMHFTGSNQPHTEGTDELIKANVPWSQYSFIEQDFGAMGIETYNQYGNTIFVNTFSLAGLQDGDGCPDTRKEVLMRVMEAFELYAPMDVSIDDVETCKNAPTPIGFDIDVCGDYARFNTIDGGSGYFSCNWYPTYGIDDATSPNPVFLNPLTNKIYQVTVTDAITGEQDTKQVNITVNSGPDVKVPLFVMHPQNTAINLNDKILSVTGGATPYEEYIWTDSEGNTVDPENEIPAIGLNRYYLQVVDANGCTSRTARMIVYVSWYKEGVMQDIAAGENGNSILYAYPVPAEYELNLVSEFAERTNATVRIVNTAGQEMLSFERNGVTSIEERLNISWLSSGVYMIIVESENDIVIKKFIKR